MRFVLTGVTETKIASQKLTEKEPAKPPTNLSDRRLSESGLRETTVGRRPRTYGFITRQITITGIRPTGQAVQPDLVVPKRREPTL